MILQYYVILGSEWSENFFLSILHVYTVLVKFSNNFNTKWKKIEKMQKSTENRFSTKLIFIFNWNSKKDDRKDFKLAITRCDVDYLVNLRHFKFKIFSLDNLIKLFS